MNKGLSTRYFLLPLLLRFDTSSSLGTYSHTRSTIIGNHFPISSNSFLRNSRFVTKSSLSNMAASNDCKKIIVIGAGASGMFAATAAAEAFRKRVGSSPAYEVTVLESSGKTMTKVAISGGGRCNVMHDTEKTVPQILSNYPRGEKELLGIFNKRFTPLDARRWFESHGVVLKTESDGRVFPVTDSSQTVIDAIAGAASQNGVKVNKKCHVISVTNNGEGDEFIVQWRDKTLGRRDIDEIAECEGRFDAVILATGSAPVGYSLAKELGHDVVRPVPSLFTLGMTDEVREDTGGVLYNLAGVSVPLARLTLKVKVPNRKKKKMISQEGPLLITHHGVSGPVTLRLSAFAAREFHSINYTCDVILHLAPQLGTCQDVEELLWSFTSKMPQRRISSFCPLFNDGDHGEKEDEFGEGSKSQHGHLPKRLWKALVQKSDIPPEMVWADASKSRIRTLARHICELELHVTSKATFKEEFVTSGGIPLKEIDMRTMMSKKCPGLFFCGEVIDVDGVTGGFNFMNCWGTGFVAGNSAVDFLAQ